MIKIKKVEKEMKMKKRIENKNNRKLIFVLVILVIILIVMIFLSYDYFINSKSKESIKEEDVFSYSLNNLKNLISLDWLVGVRDDGSGGITGNASANLTTNGSTIRLSAAGTGQNTSKVGVGKETPSQSVVTMIIFMGIVGFLLIGIFVVIFYLIKAMNEHYKPRSMNDRKFI